MALAAMFRERCSVIGKTPLTWEQLERAGALAMQLLTALGRRGKPPAAFQDAVRIRQQIFTLLVRAYNKVRKAVRYVRWWHRDEERFAPSLYRGRTGKAPAVVARPRRAAGLEGLSGLRASAALRTPERDASLETGRHLLPTVGVWRRELQPQLGGASSTRS